jgi:hypothetical protein
MTERVLNVNGTTIIWDVPVFTDQITLASRLGVVPQDEKDKTCLLIDIAITNDSQLNTKETEKLSKYADLKIEGSKMWKVRTNFKPVITGTLGKNEEGIRSVVSIALKSSAVQIVTEDDTNVLCKHHS